MKQYLELAEAVKTKGTYKAPAREGMPGTTSLFGYQFRHDLSEGFPLLTTKKLSFKNIVVELLWFLRGDTDIKFLVDNGCNIWNEDAYNYYVKIHSDWENKYRFSFDEFVMLVKMSEEEREDYFDKAGTGYKKGKYQLGDCGKQYGWLWRNWGGDIDINKAFIIDIEHLPKNLPSDRNKQNEELRKIVHELGLLPIDFSKEKSSRIDQIKELIEGLLNNPMSRRHIISAWNPATLDDMALNACHALVQFNCRPLTHKQKMDYILENYKKLYKDKIHEDIFEEDGTLKDSVRSEYTIDMKDVPEYYLDCQMYQRSADLFLGVPYNIASYALLTHILCKICNMIPGEFIHTFGDVHIYDNHMNQINEQLTREPKPLPKLICLERNEKGFLPDNLDKYLTGRYDLDDFIDSLEVNEFRLRGYDPHPAIKGELSTGLKK